MKMKNCGVFVLVCGLFSSVTIWGGNETNVNRTSLNNKLCLPNSSAACKMSSNKSAFFSRKVSSTIQSSGAWSVHPHAVISSSFLSYSNQMSKNKIMRVVSFFVACDSLFI
jgi:hypothetical protein